MEPFIILAVAAIALVAVFIIWNKRSKPTETRPEDDGLPQERRHQVNRSP